MLLTVVSIMDEVADFFQAPMTFHNSGEAVRYFTFLAQSDDSPVGKFARHHHLYLVGEFENDTGVFYAKERPALLISGINIPREVSDNE